MRECGNHQFKHGLDHYRTYEWLNNKYWKEELSMSQIAKIIGIGLATIQQWMDKAGVKRRNCGARTGAHHCRYKGWHVNTQGYKLILKPNHPNSNKQGYVREHIIIAEKTIGRYLAKEEITHHINHKKTDNRPSNLYVFSNASGHNKYHRLLEFKKIKPITKSNLSMYV